MNRSLRTLTLFLATSLSLAAPLTSFGAEYELDKNHSMIGFNVRRLLTSIPGNFRKFDGTFSFDDRKPEASRASLTIETASVDTGVADRDKHLRSDDFFNAPKFPKITFTSTKISSAGDKRYKMEGMLTIRDATRPVTLDVEYVGSMPDTKPGLTRSAFVLKGVINRKDYGVNWNKALDKGGFMLADDVNLDIKVEATTLAR